jgi:EAL domain-containing protein (putative c-di-GMP-specific phosphodiesterase class I)
MAVQQPAEAIETEGPDSPGPYGESAARVLEIVRDVVAERSEAFVGLFYQRVGSVPRSADVLGRLSAEEVEHLRARQAQHLVTLLSPELTEAEHRTKAKHAGVAHALVGVDVLWLVETYSLYLKTIADVLAPLELETETRARVMEVVSHRILVDMQGQVSGHGRIDSEIENAMVQIDQHVLKAANLTDLVRGAMAIIGSISGDISLFFARVDARGELQIEASQGEATKKYQEAMESGVIPKISIDPQLPSGQGPGGKAWRSGEMAFVDSWVKEESLVLWKPIAAELGFRSVAAIPLLDGAGKTIALLSSYSRWPGFFSTRVMRNFLTHVQRILSYAIERLNRPVVVPVHEQQGYRQLLKEHRLEMLYQPIVSLHNGELCRVEALARLRDEDGKLITPDRFLPAFGDAELLSLFEQGLGQICFDSRLFDKAGYAVEFGINFPAEGLGDVRFEQAMYLTLERFGFPPKRLQLEILESETSFGQKEKAQAFVERSRRQGIGFAQDDLGSGHSSLLRMDQYSFDEVKIDQGLVRGALRNPHRALEFILYLTRLAHALHRRVVVEGLENLGIIEAAAILGADYGQGYGILRPKTAVEVVDWYGKYRYPVDVNNPQTALGAMAGYLLWDMQASAFTRPENAVREGLEPSGMLDRFLSSRDLHDSPLGKVIHTGGQPTLSHSAGGNKRGTQVIDYLTQYWLAEMDG